jgi:hypothetical protein
MAAPTEDTVMKVFAAWVLRNPERVEWEPVSAACRAAVRGAAPPARRHPER